MLITEILHAISHFKRKKNEEECRTQIYSALYGLNFNYQIGVVGQLLLRGVEIAKF